MKLNQTIFKAFVAVSGVALILLSCDPTTPPNPNEGEVITSLKVTCISGPDTVMFAYSDPDGNGGNAPTIDTAFLATGTTYNVSLELLDETKNPVDTITGEILAEGDEHQFFFTVTAGLNVSTVYADADINSDPIGLLSTWTTNTASFGTIMVTLRHQPDKSASGVSGGNIFYAGGETDIEVTFPVVIQ